jgi:hypothetical protein
MAFKFKDLIVAVDNCGTSKKLASCGSTRKLGVQCGTSRNYEIACLDSGEVITQTPYSGIDPHYQNELRQVLVYALNASKVKVARPTKVEVLLKQMTPNTREDIEGLERRLLAAVKYLRKLKRKLPDR